MHIKKLFRGFNTSAVDGAVIAPFLLILCRDIQGAVFAGIWCGTAFIFVALAAYLLSRWYTGPEFAVLTLSLSGFSAYLVYIFAGKPEYETALILMVLSFMYLMSLGTEGFLKRPHPGWCAGVFMGLFSAAIFIGVVSSFAPAEPGYRFIAAAFFVVICRKVSRRLRI